MNFRPEREAFQRVADLSEIAAPADGLKVTNLELKNVQLENKIKERAGLANFSLEWNCPRRRKHMNICIKSLIYVCGFHITAHISPKEKKNQGHVLL